MSGMSGIGFSQSSVFGSTAYFHRESALQNSIQKEKPFAPPTGNNPMNPLDSANISDAGRKAAEIMQIDAQKTQNEALMTEQPKVEPVKTMVGSGTLDSGAKVSVYIVDYAEGEEKPIDGPDQKTMAEITKKDGSIETHAITENTVINEDSSGNLQVNKGLANYSHGNDVIISMSGRNAINSGDGDDTIMLVGENSGGKVNLGTGDKNIIVNGNASGLNIVQDYYITSTKHSGDVNVLVRGHASDLSLGEIYGDNTVKVEGSATNLRVMSNNGDNNVTVDGYTTNLNVSTFEGNNTVIIGRDAEGIGIRGFGDNTLVVNGHANNVAMRGTNDNTMLVEGNASNVRIDAYAGIGDNNIYVMGNLTDFTLKLGHGDNNISVGGDASGLKYELDADHVKRQEAFEEAERRGGRGAGSNDINIGGSLNDSNIDTGGGSGNVSILGDVSGLKINLGDGINNFLLKGDADFLDYKSGNGKDNFSVGGNFSNSTLNTGGGGDTVSIDGNVNSSNIKTGAEQDKTGKENNTFSLGGLIHNSVIDGETYAKFRPEWVPSFG